MRIHIINKIFLFKSVKSNYGNCINIGLIPVTNDTSDFVGNINFTTPNITNGQIIYINKLNYNCRFTPFVKLFNINFFKSISKPIEIPFKMENIIYNIPSVMDIPLKLSKNMAQYYNYDYNKIYVPSELNQLIPLISRCLEIEKKENYKFDDFYYYLTVNCGVVEPNNTQRRPGWHVDGYYGAERCSIKLNNKKYGWLPYDPNNCYDINDSLIYTKNGITYYYNEGIKPEEYRVYVYSDNEFLKTEYVEQIDMAPLCEVTQKTDTLIDEYNMFLYMNDIIDKNKIKKMDACQLYYLPPYTVHQGAINTTPYNQQRLFFRLTGSPFPFDRIGNTRNPMFCNGNKLTTEYSKKGFFYKDWKM